MISYNSRKKHLFVKIRHAILMSFAFMLMLPKANLMAQEVLPILQFPQPGLDDMSTYSGYATRFYRDSGGSILQVYIKQKEGRIVNLWADAANESISFTTRDKMGEPAALTWHSPEAKITADGNVRHIEYTLRSSVEELRLGHFLLNTMRLERDFQHFQRHTLPFDAEPFIMAELTELTNNLEKLPVRIRTRHLALLKAGSVDELRSRFSPEIRALSKSRVRVEAPSFDGRNMLYLELSVRSERGAVKVLESGVSIHTLVGEPIELMVKIGTDSRSLAPVKGVKLFNRDFLEFYERARSRPDFERLARQVTSMEISSTEEKLFAGLPNYATYFGRDMMMSALMLEPVLKTDVLEYVISSVLGKLNPDGEVSHEEGLGMQAVRENSSKYNNLISIYLEQAGREDREAAVTLQNAEAVLENLQRVTENYHMVDDDFQLPILTALYLTNINVTRQHKREFLESAIAENGKCRHLELLLRNLAYVARVSAAYAEDPVTENLISFRKLDARHWHAGSWRDSGVGYANGAYAMDVNVIWVPLALSSIETIVAALHDLNIPMTEIEDRLSDFQSSRLSEYIKKPDMLRKDISTWQSAIRHFEIRLSAEEVQKRVAAKLHWFPETERIYWRQRLKGSSVDKKDVEFLAVALDQDGKPIPVMHTDFVTWLFLDNFTEQILSNVRSVHDVLHRLRNFVIPYPVGLLIENIGPVVSNDTYASKEIWEDFKRDHYHSPTVVWGREVNLLFLGLAKQILAAYDSTGKLKDPRLLKYVAELHSILEKNVAAVEASGLKHNELWSYRVEKDGVEPERYGTTNDIQLWNLTDLAVQFLFDRIDVIKAKVNDD